MVDDWSTERTGLLVNSEVVLTGETRCSGLNFLSRVSNNGTYR